MQSQAELIRVGRVAGVVIACALLVSVGTARAAAAPTPIWQINAGFAPTNLPPGGEGQVVVVATNLGDEEVDGASPNAPVTVSDKLPSGLEITAISGIAGPQGLRGLLSGVAVECSSASVSCEYAGPLPPYEFLEMTITVKVLGAVSGKNEASATGGGAKGTSAAQSVTVSSEPTRFGVEDYELLPTNEDGSLDTQAGSHPFQMTDTLELTKIQREGRPAPAALTKDLQFQLPPGLVANVTAVPQCTAAEFDERGITATNGCPADTAVGVETPTAIIPENELGVSGPLTWSVPLFNLTPSVGEPARFGFDEAGARVTLDTSVRTGGDYGVTVSVNNITQAGGFMRAQTTFWGVPGDPRHDQSRGWECIDDGIFGPRGLGFEGVLSECTPQAQLHPASYLTLPTSCASPFETSLEGESWAAPNKPSELSTPISYRLPDGLDGCNRLPFGSEISVAPDGEAASTPTGLSVDVHVPQEATLNPEGLAGADVKDITVALPEGVMLNPAGANGLEACSEAQIGFTGVEAASGRDSFTSGLPEPFCPDASKVGTVKIKTPLLPNLVEGAVYLATQNANPFGSLVAIYIVAEDPVSGFLVKLPGEVTLNGETGQLVTTIKNSPELPFEDAELHFFGGERAPLATPAHCGTYTTDASFTPWSGNKPVSSSASFNITSGPHGGQCPGVSLPFSPSLTAGTTSIQAGGFSPFTTTFSREDGEQNLQGIQLHLPPGLSGLLTGVKLCGDAEAGAGTCGPGSLIGETTVSVGLGGVPYSVTGGKVYITGPYNGKGACVVGTPECAPFGLSIVVLAQAGPYNLGQVVVRGKIEVNPATAALTVTTNSEAEGYGIPHILDGIPLQIKHVNFTTTRPEFTFNPTNCSPMAITGNLSSTEKATSAVSVPFQATNCATLKFAPKITASTSGKTSKADGASFTVKLAYPNTPQGTEANIAKVKVDLPKQLPSRLTTLQKACVAAVFEANPANCPAASIVGHAKAITPLVPVPLEGPAYFVSHGGEAFPSLIIALQGYGVRLDLVGTTFISKAGVTSSTFKAVPDAPVGSFEITLPEGKFSALAANGNLCKSKLAMPTAFVGQNGVEIHTSTPISVTDCKSALGVLRHSVKGSSATLVVSVPSAGKLTATGKGLSTGTSKAGKAGTVSVKVALTNAEQAFLKKHPGRKLKAKVNLRFTPKKGAKLTTSTTILIA
jgi:hypothetical protein